jgi:hypothetical protein
VALEDLIEKSGFSKSAVKKALGVLTHAYGVKKGARGRGYYLPRN